MIVVSDTSPINYLILTEYIGVLDELYDRIVIPGTVFDEFPIEPRRRYQAYRVQALACVVARQAT